MSIGNLSSTYTYSNLKYDGNVPASRFTQTTSDNQLIAFAKKDDPAKLVQLNSLTLTADATGIYFCVLRYDSPDNGLVSEAEAYDFTDEPVLYADAGESITLSGLGICAIKIVGLSGTSYAIQGMGW